MKGQITWGVTRLVESSEIADVKAQNTHILLGPLPIVPSASLVSVPNSHLCASSLVSVVPLVIRTCLSFSVILVIPYVCSVH